MRRLLPLATLFMWAAGSALAAEPKPDCCFTNSAFSGVCRVTPGEDETCASILAYLNTPNTAGKSYCGGTGIRGGWEEVSCKSEAKPEAASAQEAGACGQPPPRALSSSELNSVAAFLEIDALDEALHTGPDLDLGRAARLAAEEDSPCSEP